MREVDEPHGVPIPERIRRAPLARSGSAFIKRLARGKRAAAAKDEEPMNFAPKLGTARSETALFLIAALVSIYAVSQFLRNSIGVIANDLARELDLSATQTGLLSSAFF